MNGLSLEQLSELEGILPKLKNSITPMAIASWLENFEEHDRLKALEVLFFVEYLNENDIILLLEELFQKAFNEIIDKFNGKKIEIAVVALLPLNDDGKSGSLMLYYLNKCPSFKRAKKSKKVYSRSNLDYSKISKKTALVFLDDLVGTGGTFDKIYKARHEAEIIKRARIVDVNLLSLFIMKEANGFLRSNYPKLSIYSTQRDKVFKENISPFNFKFSVNSVRSFAEKYGNQIPSDADGNLLPFGYGNAEALIVFAHGAPNNTLPIIWGNGNSWSPIYPRASENRINASYRFKRDVTYWIGIINRLGLEMTEDQSFNLVHKKRKLKRKWNSKIMFSLLVVLKLKNMAFGNGAIAQILGVTSNELKKILLNGVSKGYLLNNDTYTISDFGIIFMKKVQEKVKKEQYLGLIGNNFKQMYPQEYVY